ncbi:MAG: hypothetical protein ACP5E9_06505 [Candidatus Methanospirareceae archaeon]
MSIWSNDLGTNFSHPGERLWQHTFSGSEIHEVYWGNGSQGWWESYSTPDEQLVVATPNDHNDTYQYNLHIDPAKAFIQQEGTTYWLAIAPHVNSSEYKFGWKTSWNVHLDEFVAQTLFELTGPWPAWEGMWYSYMYARPTTGANESLAFVIDGPPQAPAPAPVPLLTPTGLIALVGLLSAIAAVVIVRKRR